MDVFGLISNYKRFLTIEFRYRVIYDIYIHYYIPPFFGAKRCLDLTNRF